MIIEKLKKLNSDSFLSATAILIYFALIKLIIPLLTHSDFELHRDEFLYLAMADHLDWGYLEVPPAIAVFAWITKHLLGSSIYAVRFLPALSGALTVFLTGQIAREMGGGRFAQFLTGLSFLFSLVYLRINILFQPVTFNLFFYVLAAYFFIRILKYEKPRDWICLGIAVGLGLLNKYTMLLFAFGMAIGLVLTSYRRYYTIKWLWLSTIIALLIWFPNLIWQHEQGWPFFEHMRVLSEQQLTNVQPLMFLLVQLLMNLYAAPVWICGYLYYQFAKTGKPYRPLAYLYLSALVLLLLLSGKVYYLAVTYPMLFAAGSVVIEKYIHKTDRRWLGRILTTIIIFGSTTLIPIGLPVLSVDKMIRYFDISSQYMGTGESLRWETGEYHELPQDYADMLGWKTMAANVSDVYNNLTADEKEKCMIFAINYGEAGSIDYYSSQYNLPRVVSQNGSYWLWGTEEYMGELVIVVGLEKEHVEKFYEDVRLAGTFIYPHARENGIPIHVARQPRMSGEAIWEILKQYRY
jgi:hypothetical protein